ncbi:hypothetical protein BV25DRAFT_1820654 [Artomyces pyxidatus]|uniref:Uncharacterized protein n=1 Tax=Artomyces pyxidatus TaxID=48021 RepID=A0ACB8TDX2_9AGAM|nr:hypothetical protein BV25DRAFT_1820654 [Artomyces pyxidatus]
MTVEPRWYSALTTALGAHGDSKPYQLATIDSSNKPRVRSHIHRGFVVAQSHPALPVLLTSTDVRARKTLQIAHNNAVEIAWWIPETGDQFRIAGRARVVPAPGIPPPRGPLADCTALAALDAASFDWEAKRLDVFDAVDTELRASWCTPTPGARLIDGYETMNGWPSAVEKPSDAQTEEEKKLSQQALGKFALMVIEPLEVDWVQMNVVPNRRTRFIRSGKGWREEPVVP